MIRVRVLFFGPSRGFAEAESAAVSLSPNARISDLRRVLANDFPRLAGALPTCRFAVNDCFVRDDAMISEGNEIAVIPPVSGG